MSDGFDRAVVREAYDELEYKTFEGEFGNERSSAVPCHLQFVEEPEADADRLFEELDAHGWGAFDEEYNARSLRDGRPFYNGRLCHREGYQVVRLRVMNEGVVRIFPREHMIEEEQLADLLSALEAAFNAPLEKKPMEETA